MSEPATNTDAAGAVERRVLCDGCGDRWEESFFCKVCSGWELDRDEEGHTFRDICGNCCMCHYRTGFTVPAATSNEPDDIPF